MRKPRKIKSPNKGALALAHCGASSADIATAVDVRVNQVNYWISGERRPGVLLRDVLAEKYRIHPNAWDEPVDENDPLAGMVRIDAPAAAPGGVHVLPDALPRVTAPREVLDMAGELLEQVRTFARMVETKKTLTDTERGRILRDAAITLEKAARITGANSDIPVSKILKSPAWARLAGVIADALTPWPDAMQKVVDALKSAGAA